MPWWRNGLRKGLKIPRVYTLVGSNPTQGTGLKGESIMQCKTPNIPLKILNKLPKGGKFLGYTKSKEYVEISNTETQLRHVIAIKWTWRDKFLTRIGIFSLESGEYIEED